jgi:uncharacterized protein (DUF1330 family)
VAAYVIADVEITDPERYSDYTAQTPESIARHGGRWVARGGAAQVLEGDWEPGRIVVIEFPSMDAALEWFNSDAYQELAAIRREASAARILVVEGASDA